MLIHGKKMGLVVLVHEPGTKPVRLPYLAEPTQAVNIADDMQVQCHRARREEGPHKHGRARDSKFVPTHDEDQLWGDHTR